MKKGIAAILTVFMLLTCCACGAASESEIKGTVKQTEATAAPEEPFTIGKLSGDVYENDYFGLGFRLPEGWTFSSEEEILEMNDLAAGMLDEDLQKQLENASLVWGMMATNDDGAESATMVVENLGLSGYALSVENYFTPQIEGLKSSLEQLGYTDIVVTPKTFDVAGGRQSGLSVTGKIGTRVMQENLIGLKHGGRFACVTIFSLNENADALLDTLYAVR